MDWKVLTLDNDQFVVACRELEDLVKSSGYSPDLILSIRNGGVFVGDRMFGGTHHRAILLQRPSTSVKQHSFLKFCIRILPRAVQNRLRIIEARKLLKKMGAGANTSDRKSDTSIRIPVDDKERFRRILVIDDAVDSGNTMRKVVDSLATIIPDAEVRTAAITVTMPSPAIVPDYSLYNNGTLIRFPWSIDA